jgi:hypothetical protein
MEMAQLAYNGYGIQAMKLRSMNGQWVACVSLARPGAPSREYCNNQKSDDLKDAEREAIEMGKRIIDGQEPVAAP